MGFNSGFEGLTDLGDLDIRMSVHRKIITTYSQQESTFLEFNYFYRRSTCCRRFLHPSSGAHNCTNSFKYCQPILLPAEEEEMELVPSLPRQQLAALLVDNTRSCMYGYVLLMMGGETA